MNREALQQQIASGLDDLGLSQSLLLEPLLAYLLLLEKWNKTYNLTAIRKPQEMINKHFLDSLAVAALWRDQNIEFDTSTRLIDVGTGPGLPGIPLALCYPDVEITLLESNGKKTAFLQTVKNSLKLDNVIIKQQRVETLAGDTYDHIISRAFAALRDFLVWTQKIQAPDTCIWAMKGKISEQELSEVPKNYTVCGSFPLSVPGLEEERCLIKLVAAPTSGQPLENNL